jgi:hypothetical protein
VFANAVMPGGIMTPLQRHLPIEEQRALGWIDENGKVRDGFKTTDEGASTSVWAAVGENWKAWAGCTWRTWRRPRRATTADPWAGGHAPRPGPRERPTACGTCR